MIRSFSYPRILPPPPSPNAGAAPMPPGHEAKIRALAELVARMDPRSTASHKGRPPRPVRNDKGERFASAREAAEAYRAGPTRVHAAISRGTQFAGSAWWYE